MTTLMIVDDEPSGHTVLEALLHSHGDYRILHAMNGRQAMAMIDAEDPDLVITDALMPELDGYELTREIRRRSRHPGVPVLIFSGNYSEREMAGVARDCGANRVLSKPAAPEDLFATVDSLLAGPLEPAAPYPARFQDRHPRTVADKLVDTTYRLQAAEARLARLAESLPVGIVVTDGDGVCLLSNPALAALTGRPPAELGGHGWLRCLPEAERAAAAAVCGGRAAGGRHTVRRWPDPQTSRWLTASLHGYAGPGGEPAGAVVVICDVTGPGPAA